jgi:monofunctional biosynthetic peptidoglycan transglycosylase
VLAGISQTEVDDAAAERAHADEPQACPLADRIEAHEHLRDYLQGRLRETSDIGATAEAGQVDADAGQPRPQDWIEGADAPAQMSAGLAAEPEIVNLRADAGNPALDTVAIAPVVDAQATLRAAPDAGAPPHPIEEGAGQAPAVLEPGVQELGEVPADQEALAAVDKAAAEPSPPYPIEEGAGQAPAVLEPGVQELGEVPADQEALAAVDKAAAESSPPSEEGWRELDSATFAPVAAMEAPARALPVDSELPGADPPPPLPATAASAWDPHPAAPQPVLERPEAGPPGRRPPYAEAARAALPYLRRALWGTGVAAGGLAMTVLLLVVAYRWINPPLSTLMLGQSLAGTPIERTWVPITRISPNLVRAVVLSEDAAFCRHHGVDWSAIEEAIESDRGGSTITMQVVKNLFLWPSRSYVRKAIEIGLAYLVEAVWPKRRILEIYLNIAEWGDGVFGAEAAAHAHFDKRASRLTAEEAALLAVALPNPIERTPAAPSLATGRLAARLLARMAAARVDLSCLGLPHPAPKKAPLVPGPRLTL